MCLNKINEEKKKKLKNVKINTNKNYINPQPQIQNIWNVGLKI